MAAGLVRGLRERPGRPEAPGISLVSLTGWRGGAYALLGAAFLYPTPQRWEGMVRDAIRHERVTRAFTGLAIYPRWRFLLRGVRQLARQTGAVQAEFSRVFIANRNGCVPHESRHLTSDASAAAVVAAALEREYASEGVRLDPAVGEPPDHLTVEMEFMAFLCGRERAAWKLRQETEARRLLERQRQFLRHHLARWVRRVAREVRGVDPRGWYGEVAGTAAAFIHHDQDLLDLLLARIEEAEDGAGGGG